MQVTETQTEGLKRSYTIVISAAEIDDKIDGRLQELGSQIKVPGFRPGKVPITVLKQRYGSAVRGEILERAVNDASTQALNERGIRPAAQPKIDIVSADEGKDLEYSMELEVLPEIEPMDFAAMELERVKIVVTEEEVDKALERIAADRKTTKPLDDPRPSESGDVLVLDFQGTVKGEPHPGMVGEDHHLELGSNSFIEGFEEQLIGASPGEAREVKVTFPEQYVNDELAGQEAIFNCTVKEVLASVPAEVDDALGQAMGEENLDGLKARIREQLSGEYSRLGRERMKRQMLDKLSEKHDFPIPESMAEAEFDAIWTQVTADRERGVVDPDDEGKDEEELKVEYRSIADRRVRLGLLLSEVGRQNNIEVSQEEVNAAIMSEAHRYPGQEQKVFQFYQSNPEAQARLRAPLFEDKVIDFIAELAQIEERELTLDDLKEEHEAEHGTDDEAAAKPAKKKPAKKKASAKKAAKADSKASEDKKTETAAKEAEAD